MLSIRGSAISEPKMKTWLMIWRSWSLKTWSTTSRSRVSRRKSSRSKPTVRSKKGGKTKWTRWWTTPSKKSTRRNNLNRKKSKKLLKTNLTPTTWCRPSKLRSKTRSTSTSLSGSLSRINSLLRRKRSHRPKLWRSSKKTSRSNLRKPQRRWMISRKWKSWLWSWPRSKKPWGSWKTTWFPKGTWQLGGRTK